MRKPGLLLLCLILSVAWLPGGTEAQGETEVLNREGDELVTSLEERQATVAILLTASEAARNNADLVKAARYLNRAGRLQLRLAQPQVALKTYQEALNLIGDGDPPTRIASLNGVAAAYTYVRNCHDALSFTNQAIDLSTQTNDNAGKAQALLTLSDCENAENQMQALKTAQDALELWKSVNNKWGIAKTYSAIGYYQLTLQNLPESQQNHEAALAIWRELKIPYEEAQALINLGFVEYRRAEWQSAISFLMQGQSLLDPNGYPFEMGQITISLGEIFTETGLPDAAIINLQQAANYFAQSKDNLGTVVVSLDMGKALYLAGKYDEATTTLKTTITDAEKINEPNIVGWCNEILGQVYLALNEPATALVHFEIALRTFEKSSRVMEAARVRARMGQVYAIQKNFEKANSFYSSALKTFRVLTDRLNESATLYALGQLKLDQNDLDTAGEYLRQSIDVTEDIRRTPTSSDLTVAFSATMHERYEQYIDCLMRKKALRSADELAIDAFELSERSRARSLKELLQATQMGVIPGVDPVLGKKEQSIRQSLAVKENYKISLLSRKYDVAELKRLDAEISQLQNQYQEVVDTLGKQFSAFERLRRAQSWDLRKIQDQVIGNDETVLLEYSIGPHYSYAWAVTRNGIVSYELPSEDVITDAAQKVYSLISVAPDSNTDAKLRRASDELSRLILAPLAKSLDKRRIILVADDVLNYIPFQILPSKPGNSELLIDTHEIVNAPSATILGELRDETQNRKPALKKLVAFGNPVFTSNYAQVIGANGNELIADLHPENDRWRHALRDIEVNADTLDPTNIQPLFYTTRELRNLLEIAGSDSLILTGFDASRETLTNTDLTQYAILHFATHGVLDPRNPENSGLFLSMVNRKAQKQNGFIGLQDIYALNARVDLVVLSACRTGLGKEAKGEGLIGVTRGFMHAGASSAVASLWSVDDEATSELMKDFYSNMLQKNMTPAAALQEAQKTIRKNPRWSAPYYWAAFTFQGDYNHRISVAPVRSSVFRLLVPILLVGIVIVAGLGLWLVRRRFKSKSFTR